MSFLALVMEDKGNRPLQFQPVKEGMTSQSVGQHRPEIREKIYGQLYMNVLRIIIHV